MKRWRSNHLVVHHSFCANFTQPEAFKREPTQICGRERVYSNRGVFLPFSCKIPFADANISDEEQWDLRPFRSRYVHNQFCESLLLQHTRSLIHSFFFNELRSTISRDYLCPRNVRQNLIFGELLILRGHVRPIVRACSLRAIFSMVARAHNCETHPRNTRSPASSCQNLTFLVKLTVEDFFLC